MYSFLILLNDIEYHRICMDIFTRPTTTALFTFPVQLGKEMLTSKRMTGMSHLGVKPWWLLGMKILVCVYIHIYIYIYIYIINIHL